MVAVVAVVVVQVVVGVVALAEESRYKIGNSYSNLCVCHARSLFFC